MSSYWIDEYLRKLWDQTLKIGFALRCVVEKRRRVPVHELNT